MGAEIDSMFEPWFPSFRSRYCVFYSPMDLCYRFFKMFPFNAVLIVCTEIYRCGNIQSGVKYAMKSSLGKEVKLKPVLMILIGCVKGCGGSLTRGAIRLVRSGTLKTNKRRYVQSLNLFVAGNATYNSLSVGRLVGLSVGW